MTVNNNSQVNENPGLYSLAKAMWDRRDTLAASKNTLLRLCEAVGRPSDLFPSQWAQLFAFALDFKPDLILELGRGYGNSTCVFTEVANQLKPHPVKVLSLCISESWHGLVKPKIERVVEKSWFEPLDDLISNILTFDYKAAFANHNRILVFWDAHGYDIAECVLGTIMPLITQKPHVVLMHDMSDTRFAAEKTGNYALWRGNSDGSKLVRLGNFETHAEQLVSILDFANRNKLTLHSSDYSLRHGLTDAQKTELKRLLGDDLFALSGHWLWFSLNEATLPFHFPDIPASSKQQAKTKTEHGKQEQSLKPVASSIPLWKRYAGKIARPILPGLIKYTKALASWANIRYW